MDSKFENSQTRKNLESAFSGEAKANTKYCYYAKQARKDGLLKIAEIFENTAHNERAHGKIWFKLLHGSILPSTDENLSDCIEGERYENEIMYPEFAKTAHDEGYDEIARLFEGIAIIEGYHKERYQKLYDDLKNDRVFKSEEKKEWECMNCGYMTNSLHAPEICPICAHPKGYFGVK